MGFKTKCKGPQWHSFSLKGQTEKGNLFIQIPVGYKKKLHLHKLVQAQSTARCHSNLIYREIWVQDFNFVWTIPKASRAFGIV